MVVERCGRNLRERRTMVRLVCVVCGVKQSQDVDIFITGEAPFPTGTLCLCSNGWRMARPSGLRLNRM